MFNLLDRYLFRHIVSGTLLVLLVLVSLDIFFSFINELDMVGRGQYGYLQALGYVFLSLPRRLYEYTPTATLIGSLLGMGVLASHGEITAMRAAGKSVKGFVQSAMKVGLILALALYVLGEYGVPGSTELAEKNRAEALEEQLALNRQGGLWLRDEGSFVHVGKVLDKRHLANISIFTLEGRELRQVLSAARAEKTDAGWLLKSVTELKLSAEQVVSENRPEQLRQRLVPQNMLEILRVEPEEMPAHELRRYVDYLEENNLDSGQYRLAFWNRFLQPLSVLIMLLLALPFLFSTQRAGGTGQRLFIGVMIGIAFFLFSRMLNQLGLVYGLPVWFSALLPSLLFLAGALGLLRRV